jgi:PAS domain S-box-containing protein
MDGAKQVRVAKQHAKPTAVDLRALVDASDDAIIGKTMDGTIISWNKGAEKIYGYTAGEVLGQSISLLIPPAHQEELPAIMKLLQRGEHVGGYETTRMHKDGHLIDVAITISPMKRRGKVVGACIVARDITTQKLAHEALRLSEERFRIALKKALVIVSSQDLQLRYTWISSSAMVVDPESIIGRTDAELVPG